MVKETDNRDLSFLPIQNSSPKLLSFQDIEKYNSSGFIAPFNAFSQNEIPEVIDKIVNVYLGARNEGEAFIDTYNRIGLQPFKEYVYAKPD